MTKRRGLRDFLREVADDGDGVDERLIDELRGRRADPPASPPPVKPAATGVEPVPEPVPSLLDPFEVEVEVDVDVEADAAAALGDTGDSATTPQPKDEPPDGSPLTDTPRAVPASGSTTKPTPRAAATDVLVEGIDGELRDRDGNVVSIDDLEFLPNNDSQGFLPDGRKFEIREPIGEIDNQRFDALGNLIDERGNVVVPVDELQFNDIGDVVDEDGEVIGPRFASSDEEEQFLEELKAEERAKLEPIRFTETVDGRLLDEDGNEVARRTLVFEDSGDSRSDEFGETEDGHPFVVRFPIDGEGSLLIDADGNVVDETGNVLVPVGEILLNEAGDVIDEDGNILVPRLSPDEVADERRLEALLANRSLPPIVLTMGVDGKVRDADGNEVDPASLGRDEFVTTGDVGTTDDGRWIFVRAPVGEIDAQLFDVDGNLVNSDGDVLVPVDELLFNEIGDVVDEDGEVIGPRFASSAEEDEFLAELEWEQNQALPPLRLTEGVDNRLFDEQRDEVDRDVLEFEDERDDFGVFDDGRSFEVDFPIDREGSQLFDADGNLVDERNEILAPVDALFFDGAGNVVTEDGELLAESEDDFGVGSSSVTTAATDDVQASAPAEDDSVPSFSDVVDGLGDVASRAADLLSGAFDAVTGAFGADDGAVGEVVPEDGEAFASEEG